MSFDDSILLHLRREFSGNEKYRLFLQQIDRLETALRAENKLVLKLRKEIQELQESNKKYKKVNGDLRQENDKFRIDLGEYTATETSKKYVNMKAYNNLATQKAMWETRFWELHRELQTLKNQ